MSVAVQDLGASPFSFDLCLLLLLLLLLLFAFDWDSDADLSLRNDAAAAEGTSAGVCENGIGDTMRAASASTSAATAS